MLKVIFLFTYLFFVSLSDQSETSKKCRNVFNTLSIRALSLLFQPFDKKKDNFLRPANKLSIYIVPLDGITYNVAI